MTKEEILQLIRQGESFRLEAKKAEKELQKLKSSTTLKAGKALLYIPKKLKHLNGKK